MMNKWKNKEYSMHFSNDISYYLAYAIDLSNRYYKHPAQLIKSEIVSHGGIVFDPGNAFGVNSEELAKYVELSGYYPGNVIVEINRQALLSCDRTVFVINDVLSWGVPYEVQLAVESEKPFTLVNMMVNNHIPVYLANLLVKSGARQVKEEEDPPVLERLIFDVFNKEGIRTHSIWSTL